MGLDTAGWEVAAAGHCELGEHPLWDERDGSLIWVDILAGIVHRMDASGSTRAVRLGGRVGAVGLRREGGLVASVDENFVFLDARGRPDRDPVPAHLVAGTRFNDAACDPGGRFLAGTAAADGRSASGQLLRLQADGTVTVLLDGLVESNGLAWSPDGTILYLVDSGEQCVRRYDYDMTAGVIVGRRADLAVFARAEGVPDGLAVDADGAVWVALWRGSSLRRYAPDGVMIDDLRLPVSQPTCPTFGGPDLAQLFVTTAWEGLDASARAAEPWAGHLLSRHLEGGGVVGQPAYRFG